MANPKLSSATKRLRGSYNVTREKGDDDRPDVPTWEDEGVGLEGYAQRVHRYAESVAGDDSGACKWVRLAGQRHLRDLERQRSDGFAFQWVPDRANRVCAFVERMPHIKGKWARARENLKLEDWQVFMIGGFFGWENAETGLRRFRWAYVEVPRKNAKSTISAAVGLYLLCDDDEMGSEVYSAATTREQARIVWADAKRMVDRKYSLREQFGVVSAANAVFIDEEAATFKPLSAEAQNLDGLNIHGAIIDELHAHKTRNVVDVIETATGSREQPVQWEITTAGSNRVGICYEHRDYLTKILQGTIQEESFFGVIYTIDDGDDWSDPMVWHKANPNLGVSVFADDISRKCRKAKETPAAVSNFLTKHLNVWVNADTAWLPADKVAACVDPTMTLDSFMGRKVWIALDLASKTDICAKVYLFEDGEREGRPCIAIMGKWWIPEGAIDNSPNSAVYEGWERSGWVESIDGEIMDYDEIEDSLRDDRSRFQIEEVPYDPFQATQLATHMLAEGFPMVEYGATVKNFSEPMKELGAMIVDRRVRFSADPVLQWMFSNVVCHTDVKENIYPRKEFAENKIDGAVAAIMATARWMAKQTSTYESAPLLVLR